MKKLFILAVMLLAALQFTAAQSTSTETEIKGFSNSVEEFNHLDSLAKAAKGGGTKWLAVDGHRCLTVAAKGIYTDDGAAGAVEAGLFYKRSTFFVEGRYAEHRSGAFAGYRYDFVRPEKPVHFSLEGMVGIGQQVTGLKIDNKFSGNVDGYMSNKFVIYKAKPQAEIAANFEVMLSKKISLNAFGGIIYRACDGSKADIKTDYNFSGAEVEEIQNTLKNNSDLVKKVGWKVGVSLSFRIF